MDDKSLDTSNTSSEHVFHDLRPCVPLNHTDDEVPEERVVAVGGDENQHQVLSHYWWCPYFQHQTCCPYITGNYSYAAGAGGAHYKPPPMQAMDNSYGNPSASRVKANSAQSRRKSDDSIAGNPDEKKAKSGADYHVEKIYSCRLCDGMQETADEMAFRHHIEAHLGKDRPFVCLVCDKPFRFRSNCRNHLMAHCVARKHFVPSS